jgi:hypothetical protein
MASGFNLSPEQITPGLYRVAIDTSNTTYYPVSNGSAVTATQGGINLYDWNNSSIYTGGVPTSAAYATAQAQGNLRWAVIQEQLAAINDCRILDPLFTSAGTSGNFQPTAVSFTVAFDRDSLFFPTYNAIQKAAGATGNGTVSINNTAVTAYNGSDGSTAVTTTLLAIKDIVTKAICVGGASVGYSRSARAYSLAQFGDSQVTLSIQQPNTPANIWGTITVSQVALTGLNY